ncbi:MAG: hypothetical protein EHM20_07505 [Alphaproteobacteria bacterium]|nr:MAG: hypothetical protein EHM20_07505 [Alphaproteobacteria bacterium]
MKTLKILLLAVCFLATGITKSLAGENEAYNRAVYQMSEQVKASLKQFPFEAIDAQDNTCLMVLTFTVNKNHRMENIRVECENESLALFVQKVIERKDFELSPTLDGKYCKVPLRFVDARL